MTPRLSVMALIDAVMRAAGAGFLLLLVASLFVNCRLSSDIHVTLSNGVLTEMAGRVIAAVAHQIGAGR